MSQLHFALRSHFGATFLLLAAACGSVSDGNGSPPAAKEAALTATASLHEKDLAVIFDRADKSLVTASAKTTPTSALLPKAWVSAVSAAFGETSVGEALESENRYEDWRVVSFRVAPCAPLGPTPASDIDRLCWPEVRLVFQPLIYKVRIHERYAEAFADDRAIHALYDAVPELALSAAEAARARALVARVRSAAPATPFAPLSPAELTEFVALRDRVARGLLSETLALRGNFPDDAYRGIGERPESAGGGAEAVALGARVKAYLGRQTPPASLHALTAFSLPEGREPAHLDEWVFLSFHPDRGALVQDVTTVTSSIDGRTLATLGVSQRASQTRDDDALYDLLDQSDVPELRDSVVLGPRDAARLTPRIADRQQRLVPNTTCASCHKLNALRFDFHNMSYLEDRDVTVSPRVVRDVALDLAWAAGRGLP
jgi:hypothetical protein